MRRGSARLPLWAVVGERFALGSTFASQLCRRFEQDPDEMIRGRLPVSELRDRDVEALAYFFVVFWVAVVLNPRGCQTYRAHMAGLGLVEPRGPLALTPAGKRILAYCKADDRPRYPAKPRRRTIRRIET